MEVDEADAAAQQQPRSSSSKMVSTIPEGSDGGAAEKNSKIVTLWATVDGVPSYVYPCIGSVFLRKLCSEFRNQTDYGESVDLHTAYNNTESNLPQLKIKTLNEEGKAVIAYQKPAREGTHKFMFYQAASEQRCRRILYYDYNACKSAGIANFVNNFRFESASIVYPYPEVPLQRSDQYRTVHFPLFGNQQIDLDWIHP